MNSKRSTTATGIVHLSDNSTGSFTGGAVSLVTDLSTTTSRATTVYQEGGSVTIGGSAQLSLQLTDNLTAPGSGAVWVAGGGTLTVQENCRITASAGSNPANAVYFGDDTSVNTAEISGGSIGYFIVAGAQSTATISGGSFDFLANQGTLNMTGGSVGSEDSVIGDQIAVIRNQGTASLSGVAITASQSKGTGIYQENGGTLTLGSGVTITAGTGVKVNGMLPTIGDGVTIAAAQYGVYGGAILTGAPSIESGIADLYISSIGITAADSAMVDATGYTGDVLTVHEARFPDAHQSGCTGYAVKGVSDAGKFCLTNGVGNFEYVYDGTSGALRLCNQYAHPICGAACSHDDPSHSGASWQAWTATGETLTGGSYYLTKNVTLDADTGITVTGNVNLCLNGYTMTGSASGGLFKVESGGTLNICDCSGSGSGVLTAADGSSPVVLYGSGVLNLYSGAIKAELAAIETSADGSAGGAVNVYGGTISGEYAVNLDGNATLTLSGNPTITGSAAALRLSTAAGTTLENARVDATGYTGYTLAAEENNISGGVGGYAIRGGEGKFTLSNGGGYYYVYENGGYVIRPQHTHSYTYSGAGAIITEECACGHTALATISVPASSYTYTGSPITPAAEVSYSTGWAGGTLSITYENNIQVGTAAAKITKDNATAQAPFAITKGSQDAPDSGEGCRIDYAAETITVASGYEVYTARDGGREVKTGDPVEPGRTYYIRKAGTENQEPSDWTEIVVPPRPAAPGDEVTVTGETVKGKGDGSVTVPAGMEYSTDGGENWTSGPRTINGLSAGAEVIVRKAASDTAPHGEQQTYKAPEGTNTLTVTFDGNGGSEVADATGLSYNTPVTPPEISRTGYTLAGWYKGNDAWNFDNGITENITLRANWTLDAPKVTLEASETEVTYGTAVTLTAQVEHDAGNLEYAYAWYKNGSLISGTSDTLNLTDVADTGSYTVKVTATDSGSLTASKISDPVTITISEAVPAYTVPTGLTATYGDRLDSIALPAGWTWDGRSDLVGNAGERSHAATFTPADTDNYESVQQNITVTVEKATLVPAVASVENKEYDGDMDTEGTIELSGAVLNENPTAGGTFTFVDANAREGKAVKVTVTLDGDWDKNYKLSAAALETTATIEKKTVGLTWSGYEELVYNGQPVSVAAEATGLVGSDVCTVIVDNGTQTNAGTYTAAAIGLSNSNYQLPDAGTTQNYTIAKRPVRLRWSADSFPYDAAAKTVTATVENKVGNDPFIRSL